MKKTGSNMYCLLCSALFYVPKWRLRRAGAKFCSYSCYWKSKIGKSSWNKGTIGLTKANKGSFVKSKRKWTGSLNEYKSLHHWVSKALGKPEICSSCGGRFLRKKIHWANKSGEYKKDMNDWIRLCVACHYHFDKADKRRMLWQN